MSHLHACENIWSKENKLHLSYIQIWHKQTKSQHSDLWSLMVNHNEIVNDIDGESTTHI